MGCLISTSPQRHSRKMISVLMRNQNLNHSKGYCLPRKRTNIVGHSIDHSIGRHWCLVRSLQSWNLDLGDSRWRAIKDTHHLKFWRNRRDRSEVELKKSKKSNWRNRRDRTRETFICKLREQVNSREFLDIGPFKLGNANQERSVRSFRLVRLDPHLNDVKHPGMFG